MPTHWLLATLANRGEKTSSTAQGDTLYRIEEPLPVLDPGDILRSQEAVDPRCLPSYRLPWPPSTILGSARTEDREQALFGAEGLGLADIFNGNPPWAISNAPGAFAAQPPLTATTLPFSIGGGLGSGAGIDRAAQRPGQFASHVPFAEISPLFLKRAQRVLVTATRHVRSTSRWISIVPSPVRVAPHPFARLRNVLHVARDLGATLAELKKALAPQACWCCPNACGPSPDDLGI